jgi:hypothetical protein
MYRLSPLTTEVECCAILCERYLQCPWYDDHRPFVNAGNTSDGKKSRYREGYNIIVNEMHATRISPQRTQLVLFLGY